MFKPAPKNSFIGHGSIQVGGIAVEVHHRADKVDPFDPDELDGQQNVKILFLTHGRTRSQLDSESLGLRLLHEYYSKDQGEDPEHLIVFSWDLPNHGTRIVDEARNLGWEQGNSTHAIDMLSCIEQSVNETKMIADFAPALLPGYKNFKSVKRIISGVSLGGHVTIRVITRFPRFFDAAIPFIGCFDLTTLMLRRLEPSLRDLPLFHHSYGIIKSRLGDNASKYPAVLFALTAAEDGRVSRFYDTRNTKTLAMFGEEDTVVPPEYSETFLEAVGAEVERNPKDLTLTYDKKFYCVLYPCGHMILEQMTLHAAQFLLHL